MASILRQIVASPRARHPEAGLDLCYVTDNIIATSGPSSTYPQVAYRNPLKDLVRFLDKKHGDGWAIWEFRAEGTGYPDAEVYGRVRHYPWPDHHPPPFALIPLIMASMRNWLNETPGRVVVVHCKAGKGRSGTISCSYLISEEGWTPDDARERFTTRRMRPGFGNGVSIPSQVRWIGYVDRWTKHGKTYVERPVEVLELHVWGLRDGVKIAIEGYVEEGKVIKKFHSFQSAERRLVRGVIRNDTGFADAALDLMGKKGDVGKEKPSSIDVDNALTKAESEGDSKVGDSEFSGGDVIFRPSTRVVLPTSDMNIDFERRNKSRYGGFTMVTSVAHVWFNAFFEGNGPEQAGVPNDSGVFEIDWDAMDGIKGSSRKGTRAFDRIAVVWKAVTLDNKPSVVINEPGAGEEVRQAEPADWRGGVEENRPPPKLGLRPQNMESAAISRASSMMSSPASNVSEEELQGVQSHGLDADTEVFKEAPERPGDLEAAGSVNNDGQQQSVMGGVVHEPPGQIGNQVSTAELPDGKSEDQLPNHKDNSIGHISIRKSQSSS